MKRKKRLEALGLTRAEAGVYLDLLEYGVQTVSSIARTSKLHRPAIYAALPTLMQKGLITERQVGKLTQYAAEPPERLNSLVHTFQSELNDLVPELNLVQHESTPIVRRLNGKAGVYAVYEDIVASLKKGEEFYRYNAASHEDLLKTGLPKSYLKERETKQLERLVISNPDYIKSREPRLEDSLVVVPENFWPFDYNVSQIIYADKIAFIDYTQPIATIITNDTLAKFQKDIFMMLYRQLKGRD